jgi:excisionase family DNA binding protein
MLTIKEVAERLRLDPETIRLRIVSGELAAVKTGNGKTSPYRISEEALDDFLKRQATGAKP